MTSDDLDRLRFQRLQIVAIDLHRQRAFHAAHRFFQVVGNGLRKVPDHSRNFLQLAIHGGDQALFVLMEDRPPFLLGQQIDKEFGVEKAGGVGAVVGPPDSD